MLRALGTVCSLATIATLLNAPLAAQVQEARLTASNAATSDILGFDLALDGDTVLAGAPFAPLGGMTGPGRAFIFQRVGGSWQQIQTLRPSTIQQDAWFGADLALSGDTATISASGEDVQFVDSGAVYVFDQSGGVWTENDKLTPMDAHADQRFGVGNAIQGDRAVVGAWGARNAGIEGTGAAYVFERVAGVWTEVAKLVALDAAMNDGLGAQVALDGDRIVASAPWADHGGFVDPGAVYVSENIGGAWQQTAKLTPSDPQDGSRYGISLSIDNDTIVVGAERHEVAGMASAGAAYVYERNGANWSQVARLTAESPDVADRYGSGVAVDGETIIVGAHLDNTGSRVGAAYVYRRIAGAWEFDIQLLASDGGNTNFGWRVDLQGDQAAIAGPFFLTNRGAAYVFTGMSGVCVPGDLNGDGVVDLADLGILLADFGCTGGACAGDIDGDGDTDLADLGILLANFGQSCP